MTDSNLSEKISEAITNVIKKTKTFEKSERIGKMMIGVGIICVFNFILSGFNYFSLLHLSNENKKIKYICQKTQNLHYDNCIKMNQNGVEERKSISVSTSTTDLNTTKTEKNLLDNDDILYDYCSIEM